MIEKIIANHQAQIGPSFESTNKFQALMEQEIESDVPLADPSWARGSRRETLKLISVLLI